MNMLGFSGKGKLHVIIWMTVLMIQNSGASNLFNDCVWDLIRSAKLLSIVSSIAKGFCQAGSIAAQYC